MNAGSLLMTLDVVFILFRSLRWIRELYALVRYVRLRLVQHGENA